MRSGTGAVITGLTHTSQSPEHPCARYPVPGVKNCARIALWSRSACPVVVEYGAVSRSRLGHAGICRMRDGLG
jgi:hypothetical protein